MSDPEYNAARRAKGLRAVAQGLNINLDLEVAIVCLNHAADKIEELEREQDEFKNRALAAMDDYVTEVLKNERLERALKEAWYIMDTIEGNDAVDEWQNKYSKYIESDYHNCPECDALASHGVNDGPCERHKL